MAGRRHQILIWRGLIDHEREDIATRLIYRWLYTITRTAVDYNGMIPEKFDVADRSFQTDVEYGNVATDFELATPGFGWTNASYQVGLALLPEDLRHELARLVPPEWLFGPRAGQP